jgi:major membrane immunogen (membrane-anchored lipoprotein)
MEKFYIIDVVVIFSLLIIACSDKDVNNVGLSMTSDDGTFGGTG